MQRLQILENIWYCAAHSAELTAKPLARVICGIPMVLYRGESGAVAALEDRCPHRQAPLSMGAVLGDHIQCNYHGLVFDQKGACVHIPRQDQIPSNTGIKAFTTIERWGFIWLWWGDQQKVDTSTIPDLPWTHDANRQAVYFHFDNTKRPCPAFPLLPPLRAP